jgi:hypothetical protein
VFYEESSLIDFLCLVQFWCSHLNILGIAINGHYAF